MTNRQKQALQRAIKTVVRSKYGYDIVAALRGPDVGSDYHLKYLTTARIRIIVGCNEWLGMLKREKNTQDELKEALFLRCDLEQCHFNDHYQLAIRAIREVYGYDLLTEKKV